MAQAETEVTEAPQTDGPQTLSGRELRDVGSTAGPKEPITDPAQAVQEMAGPGGEKAHAQTQSAALDWFVGDEPVGGTAQDFTTLSVNVGGETEDTKREIDWTIAPIQLDVLRTIRKRANNTREAKKTGVTDEFQTNLEIVAVCTVDPNLAEAARSLHGQGKIPQADRVEALRYRFKNRPGFITQLAGKILTISGFDEDDIQDKLQVDAAGNS